LAHQGDRGKADSYCRYDDQGILVSAVVSNPEGHEMILKLRLQGNRAMDHLQFAAWRRARPYLLRSIAVCGVRTASCRCRNGSLPRQKHRAVMSRFEDEVMN